MATAGVASVRPVGSIKADMGVVLAKKGLSDQITQAVTFAPKKAAEIATTAAQLLKVDVILKTALNWGRVIMRVAGQRAAVTAALTSHVGQSTVRAVVRTTYNISKWAMHKVWRGLTWLPRKAAPVRRAIEYVETQARKVTMPEHNPLLMPAKMVKDYTGWAVSADRWWMRVTNLVASSFVYVRLARYFVPWPWRIIAYIPTGIVLFGKFGNIFPSFFGSDEDNPVKSKKAAAKAKAADAEVVASGVVDEAKHITKEAAEKAAAEADAAVITLEEQKLKLDSEIEIKNAEAIAMREAVEAIEAAEKEEAKREARNAARRAKKSTPRTRKSTTAMVQKTEEVAEDGTVTTEAEATVETEEQDIPDPTVVEPDAVLVPAGEPAQ